MASVPKVLQIVGARRENPETRTLVVECIDGGAFGAVGGKYVIVHTGLSAGDRAVKRAYSLVPVATHAGRAEITVKRVGGPGSDLFHAADVGQTFAFSGPWGKLVPEGGLAERTLVVATDTGITSALGIAAQAAVSGTAVPASVWWLKSPREAFTSDARVREFLRERGVALEVRHLPDIGDPTRPDVARALVEEALGASRATELVLSGDGAVLYAVREAVAARAEPPVDVRLECFFNNPERKSAAS